MAWIALAGATAGCLCTGVKDPAPQPESTAKAAGTAPGASARPRVTIDESGFSPSTLTIDRANGHALEVEFYRETDKTCVHEVILPDVGARKVLPLRQVVVLQIPSGLKGELKMQCGSGARRGAIVVR